MTLPKAVAKDHYTEPEAAQALGISISRLHELLDLYIFNDGTRRPSGIEFSASDLLLFAYWHRDCAPPDIAPRDDIREKKVVSIDSHSAACKG